MAPSTYPFPGLRTNRIGRRNLRNRKSLDPYAKRPRRAAPLRGQGNARRATDARLLTGLPTAGPIPADLHRTEPEFRAERHGYALRSLAAELVDERHKVAELRREVAELRARLQSLKEPHPVPNEIARRK